MTASAVTLSVLAATALALDWPKSQSTEPLPFLATAVSIPADCYVSLSGHGGAATDTPADDVQPLDMDAKQAQLAEHARLLLADAAHDTSAIGTSFREQAEAELALSSPRAHRSGDAKAQYLTVTNIHGHLLAQAGYATSPFGVQTSSLLYARAPAPAATSCS